MMGRRLPADGRSSDAVTAWRWMRSWNHIRRSFWKRKLRRRERRHARLMLWRDVTHGGGEQWVDR